MRLWQGCWCGEKEAQVCFNYLWAYELRKSPSLTHTCKSLPIRTEVFVNACQERSAFLIVSILKFICLAYVLQNSSYLSTVDNLGTKVHISNCISVTRLSKKSVKNRHSATISISLLQYYKTTAIQQQGQYFDYTINPK